jgi:hypothetical protein
MAVRTRIEMGYLLLLACVVLAVPVLAIPAVISVIIGSAALELAPTNLSPRQRKDRAISIALVTFVILAIISGLLFYLMNPGPIGL